MFNMFNSGSVNGNFCTNSVAAIRMLQSTLEKTLFSCHASLK